MDLELFVLALVSRGVATPYSLKAFADISIGGSVPALNRLENAGYLKKGISGARNRQEYVITRKGEAHVENSWKAVFQAPPTRDLEVVLRTASLALLMGEPKGSVANYLSRAAGFVKAKKPAATLPTRDGETPGAMFVWMRRIATSERGEADARTLRQLARELGRLQ
jgi:DNA-binding PadR family transcriptional regulator